MCDHSKFACASSDKLQTHFNLSFRTAFSVYILLLWLLGQTPCLLVQSHRCWAPIPFPLQCVLSLIALVMVFLPQVSHLQRHPEALFFPNFPILPAAKRESRETEAIMYHNLAMVCWLRSSYLSDFQGKNKEKNLFRHFFMQEAKNTNTGEVQKEGENKDEFQKAATICNSVPSTVIRDFAAWGRNIHTSANFIFEKLRSRFVSISSPYDLGAQ